MLPEQIKLFLDSGIPNQWLKIGHLEIYFRKSYRLDPRVNKKHHRIIRCLDIANVNSSCKGSGEFAVLFKQLKNLEGFEAIFIEQVLSNRFADFFKKNGCLLKPDLAMIPSFYYFLGE